MANLNVKVDLSVAVFKTPKSCGKCPLNLRDGFDWDSWCKHPDGPGNTSGMYGERHPECPLDDYSFEFEPEFVKPSDEK